MGERQNPEQVQTLGYYAPQNRVLENVAMKNLGIIARSCLALDVRTVRTGRPRKAVVVACNDDCDEQSVAVEKEKLKMIALPFRTSEASPMMREGHASRPSRIISQATSMERTRTRQYGVLASRRLFACDSQCSLLGGCNAPLPLTRRDGLS